MKKNNVLFEFFFRKKKKNHPKHDFLSCHFWVLPIHVISLWTARFPGFQSRPPKKGSKFQTDKTGMKR